MKFYNIENNNFSNSTDSFHNFNDFNISQISLFSLSYINLLFCLSLDEKYNEVLLLIKVFPTNLLKNNNDIKNKLDYFKLNAMMNLKRHGEIEHIIAKSIAICVEMLSLHKTVCHEKNSCQAGHLMGGLWNFERDGGRPTAYGVQAQFANHFVRLGGKPTGRERQLEG